MNINHLKLLAKRIDEVANGIDRIIDDESENETIFNNDWRRKEKMNEVLDMLIDTKHMPRGARRAPGLSLLNHVCPSLNSNFV